MKRRTQILLVCVLVFFMLPGMLVLLSDERAEKTGYKYDGARIVTVNNEEIDSERFLLGVLAAYVPYENETETLKAMAVILRTNLRKCMGEKRKISAEELGMPYLNEREMEKYFDGGDFVTIYRKFEKAVNMTKGIVIRNENGQYIDALFHQVSAGYTRDGETLGEGYEYLRTVTSAADIQADNYMQLVIYTEDTLTALIKEGLGISLYNTGSSLADCIVPEQTKNGYAEWVMVGGEKVSADEVSAVLGLQSPAFLTEAYEGKIRFLSMGIGHGYGLSIYGANALAGEGYSYKRILEHYYANIVITNE